ncbi:MAG TPA: hypothetical protein VF885_23775 [Arthrobacter sp.]
MPQIPEPDDLAGLFADVTGIFDEFMLTTAPAARPAGLFETLLGAYPDADRETLAQRLRDFIATDGDRLLRVIGEHTAGSSNFVAKHDWLYAEPEVLLVADLARRPRHLTAVVKNTDFDRIIGAMIDEFRVP